MKTGAVLLVLFTLACAKPGVAGDRALHCLESHYVMSQMDLPDPLGIDSTSAWRVGP